MFPQVASSLSSITLSLLSSLLISCVPASVAVLICPCCVCEYVRSSLLLSDSLKVCLAVSGFIRPICHRFHCRVVFSWRSCKHTDTRRGSPINSVEPSSARLQACKFRSVSEGFVAQEGKGSFCLELQRARVMYLKACARNSLARSLKPASKSRCTAHGAQVGNTQPPPSPPHLVLPADLKADRLAVPSDDKLADSVAG